MSEPVEPPRGRVVFVRLTAAEVEALERIRARMQAGRAGALSRAECVRELVRREAGHG